MSSIIKVDTIQLADGTAGTIENLGLATGALSHRNIIINGAMQVAQRGTSETGITLGGYYTADRWVANCSGATINMSVEDFTSGQTDVPTATKYLKLSATSGNNNSGLIYRIENKTAESLLNQTVTYSFWAKGTNPGGGSFDFYLGLYDGTNYEITTKQSVTLTSTWTKYTLTTAMPSAGSVDFSLDQTYMEVNLLQPQGDTSTDAWELNITLAQLEVGSVATPFEHRSYTEELARCQRYFLAYHPENNTNDTIGLGYMYTSNYVRMPCRYPVEMRIKPTLSVANSTSAFICIPDNITFDTFSLSGNSNERVATIFNSGLSSGTAKQAHEINSNTTAAYIHFDAEL